MAQTAGDASGEEELMEKMYEEGTSQQKTWEIGHVEFAGKALVQILLSAINAVSGFMEGV